MKNFGISKKKKKKRKNSKYYKIFFDRVMNVKIGKNYFETQNIPSSAPQGSILGPLLF